MKAQKYYNFLVINFKGQGDRLIVTAQRSRKLILESAFSFYVKKAINKIFIKKENRLVQIYPKFKKVRKPVMMKREVV